VCLRMDEELKFGHIHDVDLPGEEEQEESTYKKFVKLQTSQRSLKKEQEGCRHEIEKEMKRKKVNVFSEDGVNFFIQKPKKRVKHPLNIDFIKSGFIAFLKQQGVQQDHEQVANQFIHFLEERRERFATETEADGICYRNKRPPQAFF